jgi:type IV secretory pathway VirB10-like protein
MSDSYSIVRVNKPIVCGYCKKKVGISELAIENSGYQYSHAKCLPTKKLEKVVGNNYKNLNCLNFTGFHDLAEEEREKLKKTWSSMIKKANADTNHSTAAVPANKSSKKSQPAANNSPNSDSEEEKASKPSKAIKSKKAAKTSSSKGKSKKKSKKSHKKHKKEQDSDESSSDSDSSSSSSDSESSSSSSSSSDDSSSDSSSSSSSSDSSSAEVGEKRKKRPKKDPNAPKRALTAYILYCNDYRDEIKQQNSDWKFTEVMSELGRRWSESLSIIITGFPAIIT